MNRRILLPVIVLALVAAACGPVSAPSRDAGVGTSITADDGIPLSVSGDGPAVLSFPDGPSALDNVYDAAFRDPLIDPSDLLAGGPPPDGIPPIDAPVFIDVASSLEVLPANEPVVALEINGDARAYPVRALMWHEIVNDTVGGVPVVVTYCPLCNSASAFDRTVGGASTTFGTSGLLYNSALVMYDRATESLWTHFDGTAVVGVLAGEILDVLPSPLLAWSDFRAAYPTGSVLDVTRTGFTRDYGRNPYVGYDDSGGNPDLFRGVIDDRAAAMERIVGIATGGGSIAYRLSLLREGSGSVRPVTVGERALAIFWLAGQSSALDDDAIAGGRDVGSVGVFEPLVDGMALTFQYDGGAFVDSETGSRWSITGEAVAGPLSGTQLNRVPHLDTFWFAWAAYQPDTTLAEG